MVSEILTDSEPKVSGIRFQGYNARGLDDDAEAAKGEMGVVMFIVFSAEKIHDLE